MDGLINDQDDLSSGFGRLLDNVCFAPTALEKLPATCNLFYEARFFAQLAARVPAVTDQTNAVNWYASACITAMIAVRDAAKHDFAMLGREHAFDQSAIAMEFFLRSDNLDPALRDPLAVNRVFRELRNLRVHYGKPLVLLKTRVLESDIARNPSVGSNAGQPRWFLRPLAHTERKLLKKKHLTDEEVDRFNKAVDTRPLATVLAQHLYVLSGAVERTGVALVAQGTGVKGTFD
jgi:hypothetical protein